MQSEFKSAVWAHRGFSQRYRENSLRAFAAAIAIKADGIELDVQRTRDGKLVVVHDEFLERLCGEDLHVADCDYADIPPMLEFKREEREEALSAHEKSDYQKVELLFKNRLEELDGQVEKYSETKIPLLSEVLALVAESDLRLNIEVKNSIDFFPGIEDEILKEVEEAGMRERVIYSSFNHQSMAYLARKRNVECGILYADILYEPFKYAKAIGAKALHPALNSLRLPGFIDEAGKEGIKIHSWTANRFEFIVAALQLGVDALITDVPHVALQVRDRGKEFGL